MRKADVIIGSKGGENMAKAGRKPRFSSAEDMQLLIDAYFGSCRGEPLIVDGEIIQDKNGNVIFINQHPPTITGLALSLGFNSRQSLLNYQGKKEFVDTITRAKSRVEQYAEERLFDRDGQRGAEFTLKYNFRWAQDERKDKEKDGEGEGGIIEIAPVMPTPEEATEHE